MWKKIINPIDNWIDKHNVRTILLTALVFLYGFFCLLKMYFPKSTTITQTVSVEYVEQPKLTIIIEKDPEDVEDEIITNVTTSKKSVIKKITSRELAFIEDILRTAKEESKKYNIPVAIKIGQAIIESGYGTSPIAVNMNNHYGIKHKIDFSDEEKTLIFGRIKHKTTEFFENKRVVTHAEFVSYTSRWASIRHHSIFLRDRIDEGFNEGYAAMKNLSKKDYKKWAAALQKAKYSTSPDYAKKLIRIIEQYKLYEYDK